MKPEITIDAWEDQNIISLSGAPIGGKVAPSDAKIIAAWLTKAWPGIERFHYFAPASKPEEVPIGEGICDFCGHFGKLEDISGGKMAGICVCEGGCKK